MVDTVLASWIAQLTRLCGQPLVPAAIHIEFEAPEYAARYEALFGRPVAFGAEANQLQLDQRALSLRNPEHCPGTWRHLVELCEGELERRTRTRSLRERVTQMLGPMLKGRSQTCSRSLPACRCPPGRCGANWPKKAAATAQS